MADYADDDTMGSEDDKDEILEEVESVSNVLTESETEDSLDEEQIFKNERIVQFILNSGESVQTPENSAERVDLIGLENPKSNEDSLRIKCLKRLQLNTQTGGKIYTTNPKIIEPHSIYSFSV